jgi:hypothetical protein
MNMKKTLALAALISAAMALSAMPTMAATAAAPKPAVDAKCFFLPLLPDCLAEWKSEDDAMMTKMMAPPAKMAMAMPAMTMPAMTMPAMPGMPSCTKAAAGAGHLLDCSAK